VCVTLLRFYCSTVYLFFYSRVYSYWVIVGHAHTQSVLEGVDWISCDDVTVGWQSVPLCSSSYVLCTFNDFLAEVQKQYRMHWFSWFSQHPQDWVCAWPTIRAYLLPSYCFLTLICGICSSVICLCNGAISFVLLYCYIVTLVRLSLVTVKGYLLACLLSKMIDT